MTIDHLLTHSLIPLYPQPRRTDCWIAIKGLVYDVTPYLQEHPGGVPAIVMNAGKDATEDFEVSG